jgi:hypothetical protein
MVFDSSLPILKASPSPFNIHSWETLLSQYPGPLPLTLAGILQYGCQIGYQGPQQLVLSKNLKSSMLHPSTIKAKLLDDLQLGRVLSTSSDFPFISSPLGLVPKGDGGFRRIHHLSHPRGTSVNDFIPDDASKISYTSIKDIYAAILDAGRHCTIIKKDIADAFRNIPIAIDNQWLLGFEWEKQFYKEACLPFGLATAPFLFNLFAEGFHWMLQSWLRWTVLHYLDDFIRVIPQHQATLSFLQQAETEYHILTSLLGIPENKKKDAIGTVVTVLGIQIDTNTFEARLSPEKLAKALRLTTIGLLKSKMSLFDIQSISGFLSWCAEVVRLGKIYLHHLWVFMSAFPPTAASNYLLPVPYNVRLDLAWWNTLLPSFNGIYLFQEQRSEVLLYTDASQRGLGAYYLDTTVTGPPRRSHSFSMRIARDHLGQHINILELRAIQAAFLTWGHAWAKQTIVIHTDSEVAFSALTNNKAHGLAFYPLRHILLVASQYDIILKPKWIAGKTNLIADALSRFNWNSLANLCPTWQFPYDLTPFPHGFKDLSPPLLKHGRCSSGTA